MARVALGRGGRGSPAARQSYDSTMSGYGATHGESVGYNPRNAYAYSATQAAKAYGTSDKGDTSPKAKGYVNE